MQNTMQHDYRKLKIWNESVNFALEVYKMTGTFPKEELYGLTSQMRRASVSIPSNIAEGSKRTTNKDFKSFLAIAQGSCAEIETQLYIGKEIGYIKEKEYQKLSLKLLEIMKMLAVFGKNIAT